MRESRRAPAQTPSRVGRFVLLGVAAAGATALVLTKPWERKVERAPVETETVQAASPDGGVSGASRGKLTTKNRDDRSGYFFVPETSADSIPLAVLFHGTGGSGRAIAQRFTSLAEEHGFAIVAPDSGYVSEAKAFTWYVGSRPGEKSPDSPHIAACIDEVVDRFPQLSEDGWIAVGHSGGASSAPFLATHDDRFDSFAVSHGGVFERGFGNRKPDGWFSTGTRDRMRSPSMVEQASRDAERTGLNVTFKTYPGGHSIGPAEASDIVEFWLGAAE